MTGVREEFFLHVLIVLVMVGSGIMYWLLAKLQTSYSLVPYVSA